MKNYVRCKTDNTAANNKRVAKNTIMLYLRMMVLISVNLYTSRVILEALGVNDYGLYSVVGSVVVFLGFLNVSMTAASQRFLSFAKGVGDTKEENSVFNSLCVAHVIIAILILILGESAGIIYINNYLNVEENRIFPAHIVFQFSLCSLLCKTIAVPYNAAIISNEKMDAFALISILEGLLQLGVAFLLPFFDTDRLVLYSALMFGTVFCIQWAYRLYSSHYFRECKLHNNWKKEKMFEIFNYSGWNLLGALSSVLMSQGLNMVLNVFFGVVINAARGIASQVNGALSSFTNNFLQALNPQIVRSYVEKDYDKMRNFIIQGTRLSYFLLMVLTIPFIFNMQLVLAVWLEVVPDYAVILCILELCYMLISSLSSTLLIGVMATGDIKKYQIIVATINVTTLPLAIVALNIYLNPYLASCIMIGIGCIAFTASLFIASKQLKFEIAWFISRLLKSIIPTTLLSAVLSYLILVSISDTGEFVFLILRMGISFIVCVLAIWWVGISNAEKAFISSIIRKRLHL